MIWIITFRDWWVALVLADYADMVADEIRRGTSTPLLR